MQTLAERIITARKEKGYTQEQLATLLNVSRPTISHWENGRVLPDVEMLRLLSSTLETDFLSDAVPLSYDAQNNAPTPPVDTVPTTVQKEADLSKPLNKTWLYVVLAALLLLIIGSIYIFSTRNKAESTPQAGAVSASQAPQTQTEPPKASENKQTETELFIASCERTPVEGQAFVQISTAENPLHPAFLPDSDTPFWLHTVTAEETNGVAFTIEKVSEVFFSQGSKVSARDYAPGDLDWGKGEMRPNIPLHYGGGFPVQDLEGLGIVISGTDANKNALTFSHYVVLSNETKEN